MYILLAIKSLDANYTNDVLFGAVVPPSGKFQEVEGESEERRRHRLNHHQNTQERMVYILISFNYFPYSFNVLHNT